MELAREMVQHLLFTFSQFQFGPYVKSEFTKALY